MPVCLQRDLNNGAFGTVITSCYLYATVKYRNVRLQIFAVTQNRVGRIKSFSYLRYLGDNVCTFVCFLAAQFLASEAAYVSDAAVVVVVIDNTTPLPPCSCGIASVSPTCQLHVMHNHVIQARPQRWYSVLVVMSSDK